MVTRRLSALGGLVAAATAGCCWSAAPALSSPLAPNSHASEKHGYTYSSTVDADINGYTYKLSTKVVQGQPVMGNPQSLPPSWYVVDLPVSGTFTITNETPGRDAPDPSELSNLNVVGLYRLPSALCTQPNLEGTGPGSSPDAVHDVVAHKWYCSADTIANIQDNASGAALRPGQSEHYVVGPLGSCESTVDGDTCPSPFPVHAEVFVYTKRYITKVLDELRQKPPLVVAYWGLDAHGKGTTCTATSLSGGGTVWVLSSSVRLATSNCS